MNPLTLLALTSDPRFLTGAGAGLVGAILIRATGSRLDWFLVWSVAAIFGLARAGADREWNQVEPWMMGVVVLTVVAVTWAAPRLLRRTDAWVPPALFGLAALGVWGTVPDTEHARIVLGAATSMVLVASGPKAPPSTVPGMALATAVLGWVALVDGWPRASAVVGACGAVGMMVAGPAALAVARARGRAGPGRPGGPAKPVDPWILIGAQVLLVILSGRIAGQAGSAGAAVGLWVVFAVGVSGAWVALAGRRGGVGRG